MPKSQRESSFRRGVACLDARRHLTARRHLARAVREGGRDAPWAVQELLQTFLRRGEGADAEAFLREILLPDSPLLLHGLGCLARRQGRAADAMALLERAFAGGRGEWASANELGWLLFQSGQREEGMRLLRRAARHFARKRDVWGEATALTHLGTCDLVGYKFARAERTFAKARVAKERAGDTMGLATVTYSAGQIDFQCARYAKARDAFERSRAMQQKTGFKLGAAMSINAIGTCCWELGDWPDAARAFRRSLAELTSLRALAPRDASVRARMNLAVALGRLSRHRAARRHLQLAVAACAAGVTPDTRAMVLTAFTDFLTERGDHRTALALVTSAIPSDASRNADRTRVFLRVDEARARLALGDVPGALMAARAALTDIPRTRADVLAALVVDARTAEARALVAIPDLPRARAAVVAATRTVARVVDASNATQRMGVAELHRGIADVRVSIALRGTRAPVHAAWRVAREAKARELRRVREAPGATPSASVRRMETEAELRDLIGAASPTSATRNRMRTLRGLLGSEQPALRKQFASRKQGTGVPPGVALVEYHVARDETWAFVAVGNRVDHARAAIGLVDLRALVARALASLRASGAALDSRAALDSFDFGAVAALHALLVEPLLDRVSGPTRHLVIVPDGPLHELPFEMLASRRDVKTVGTGLQAALKCRFLSDTHALSMAPASDFIEFAPEEGGHRPRRGLALAYSPPRGSVVDAGGTRNVERLPGALREVAMLRRLFPEMGILTGRDVTLLRLRRRSLGRLLHVASHAFADDEASGRAGLVLACDDGTGLPRLVGAAELAGLRMGGGLVTLSGCETAHGKLRHREGLMSLGRAFIEAGASAVLATRWRASDAGTQRLMAHFYRMLAAGVSRAEALMRARRRLREAAARSGSWMGHPFVWANLNLTDLRPRAL